MKNDITDDIIDKTLELGGLLMQFGTVYRATYLNHNLDKESDTDHTTMLAIIACAVAAKFHPAYDLGKVAHYALVHDLVEVYAGDVNTINFTTIDNAAKQASEDIALEKIKKQFGEVYPWIHTTIENYEALKDPESRFIKTLDKCMPAITHYFTDNQAVNEHMKDPIVFEKSVRARDADMIKTFAYDQHIAMLLRQIIVDKAIDKKYKHHGVARKKS